ncbi:hypothetical protein PSGL111025_13985 [Psychrobacter glaciei]
MKQTSTPACATVIPFSFSQSAFALLLLTPSLVG